jgi:hypothetical protein
MFGYKVVASAVALATVIGSSAFAADGALTAGKPAGVAQAQVESGVVVAGAIGALVLTGIAIAVSQSGDHNDPANGTFDGAVNKISQGTTGNK